MAKPTKSLELHYPMIQFLIIVILIIVENGISCTEESANAVSSLNDAWPSSSDGLDTKPKNECATVTVISSSILELKCKKFLRVP